MPSPRIAHAAVDAAAQTQKQFQTQLGQLQRAVNECEATLVEFESKKTFLRGRKSQLQDQLLTLWGRDASNLVLQPNTSPVLAVVESHGTILAIDAALADASRVKQYLDERLRVAKQKLDEFSKRAPR